MRVARLLIDNVLGIQHLEIDLGKVTEITGQNASGKTSILEAVMGVFGGGDCAELIRNGESKAEIVAILDSGHAIHTNITHKKTTRFIKTPPPDKGKITAVKEWVGQYLRSTSFNPIAFIEANAKKRLEMLLEFAPLSMSYAEFESAVGKPWVPAEVKKAGAAFALANPLDQLEMVDKAIRTHRTGLNGATDILYAHISELTKTLPEKIEPSNVEALKNELKSLTDLKDGKIKAAKQFFDEASKVANDIRDAANNSSEKTRDQEIQEVRDRHDARTKKHADARDLAIKKANSVKDQAIEKANSDDIAKVEALVKDIGAEEEKAKQATIAETTKANIDKAKKEAEAKKEESMECTTRITAIAKARQQLLEKLPIEGMSIKAGDIHYKDILFDTLNTAEQFDVAFQIAEKSAGDLGLIICDGLECLDQSKWATVKARAEKSPCQFIVTRVESGKELTISSDGIGGNEDMAQQMMDEPPPAPSDEDDF